MRRICEMTCVREHCEGYPVELCRDEATERLVVHALNEGRNNETMVDLLGLIEWCRTRLADFGVGGPHDANAAPSRGVGRAIN